MDQTLRRRHMIVAISALEGSSPLWGASPKKNNSVMVIPTLHKLHENNKHYSYDDVYKLVKCFSPDRIGVEIRPEDLFSADGYLSRNYPREMIHLTREYGSRVFGFDWLGYELCGRPIPNFWWKNNSRIKCLERSFDHAFSNAGSRKMLLFRLNQLLSEQTEIAQISTSAQLAAGPYDRVAEKYYATFDKITHNTKYQKISLFYKNRNQHIIKNIILNLKEYPSTRTAIVTGADHHGPIVQALSALSYVNLVAVP